MLTLDQAAKRAATRRNNQLRKRYPLLADQWATTPEAEAERITRQRALAEKLAEEQRQSSIRAWERGMELREVARKLLPAERFAERERLWEKWHGYRVPDYDGHALADHWWCALRGTEYAFEHCPNRERHNDPAWWKPHWSFFSQCMVHTTECPTCGIRRDAD